MIFSSSLYLKSGVLISGFSGRNFRTTQEETLRFSFKSKEGVEKVIENVCRLKKSLEFSEAKFIMARQIHSDKIIEISGENLTSDSIAEIEGDSILTDSQNLLLGVITADCIPILIYEKNSGFIATVHAGWKGTSQHIVSKVLKKMSGYGGHNSSFKIFMGPHIKAFCYEIKEDLFEPFAEYKEFILKKENSYYLDLTGINLAQIRQAIPDSSRLEISVLDCCTHCAVDTFFSYRKEGVSAGCNLSFIGIKDGRIN